MEQSVDKSTNTNTISTTSNGGTAHLTQHLQMQMQTQPHSNQINGSIASANCPAQIAITDIGCCDKQLDLGMVSISVSGQKGELPVDSIVNEKHNQSQCQREKTDENDCQLLSMVNVADDIKSSNGGCGTGGRGRELNFLNLKLQCMCSDDESGIGVGIGGDENVIAKSNVDLISKRTSADDETEIEISDVEAVTEISGESIYRNHRCTHCGRGHCCFFLKCCYCTASGIVQLPDDNNTIDTSTNPIAMHENNPCESDGDNANRKPNTNTNTNSNNIAKDLTLDSCTEIGSNQNLASKRCDEICKIIRNQHGADVCSSTATALATKQCCEDQPTTDDGNDKHCSLTKSIAIGCHCRWYCIQDCTNGTVSNAIPNTLDSRTKSETTLAVQEPEIVSPITNESPANNDENRLRCCRCSKELF